MDERRIKFRHIQCFVEICREHSMKRAAEKLYLTQPAISKTLKELEEIVGTALLIRNRGGVALTKQGEVFLHFAEQSLAALQQGLAGVEQVGKAGRVRLVIGALPSVAARLMPDVIREMEALAPNVEVHIMIGAHGYMVDRLRLGAVDVVIGRLGRPETMQGLSFTQLYEERVEFMVRTGHPLLANPDLARIVDYQVIYPPEGSAIRPLVERFLIAHGVGDIPNRLETISGAFGRVYTRRSDAIWVITAGVVANEIDDGFLVPLPFNTEITRGPVGLMTRPNETPAPQEQMFHMALANVIRRSGIGDTG